MAWMLSPRSSAHSSRFGGQAFLEKKRRLHEFQMERMAIVQERRAGAYVDLLAAVDERMSWVRSALQTTPPSEAAARWFGESEGEHQFRLKARIAGFGSPDVQERMTKWTEAYERFWDVAIRAAEREADPEQARAAPEVHRAREESDSLTADLKIAIGQELNPKELAA
jgi:hypothetical protein